MPKKTEKASGRNPAGIIIHAVDGKAYFLTHAQARRARIPPRGAYATYRRKLKERGGGRKWSTNSPCGRVKHWLDTHSPNSRLWRLRSILWAENCL